MTNYWARTRATQWHPSLVEATSTLPKLLREGLEAADLTRPDVLAMFDDYEPLELMDALR